MHQKELKKGGGTSTGENKFKRKYCFALLVILILVIFFRNFQKKNNEIVKEKLLVKQLTLFFLLFIESQCSRSGYSGKTIKEIVPGTNLLIFKVL